MKFSDVLIAGLGRPQIHNLVIIFVRAFDLWIVVGMKREFQQIFFSNKWPTPVLTSLSTSESILETLVLGGEANQRGGGDQGGVLPTSQSGGDSRPCPPASPGRWCHWRPRAADTPRPVREKSNVIMFNHGPTISFGWIPWQYSNTCTNDGALWVLTNALPKEPDFSLKFQTTI